MDFSELRESVYRAKSLCTYSTRIEAENIAADVIRAAEDEGNQLDTAQRDELRCESLTVFGMSAMANSDAHAAIVFFDEALELAEKHGIKWTKGQILNHKANAHRGLAEYGTTLRCLEEALNIYEDLGDTRSQGTVHASMANLYFSQGQFANALQCFYKAVSIQEKLNNKKALSTLYGNMGLLFVDLKEIEKALEYLEKALALSEENNNMVEVSAWLGNIAGVYMNMSDHANALMYMAKALRVAEELSLKQHIANHTANMGSIYGDFGEEEAALEMFEKSLVIMEDLGRKEGIGVIHLNMGMSHRRLGRFDEALRRYRKALDLHESQGEEVHISQVYQELGNLYSKPEYSHYNPTQAEEYFSRSAALNQKLGVHNFDLHLDYYNFLKREGRWQEALQQHEIYSELKEKALSDKVKLNASVLDQRLQLAAYEKEIAIANSVADARLEVTTTLLHKVLPETVAQRMLGGETEIADYYPSVSILFADIEGFTPMSADMPAVIVVRLLNYVFQQFDRIMKKHGCEKIKTIGDGYMAVAGAPNPCDDHAERIAAAALEMQHSIELPESIREHLPPGTRFGLRIGLHTGSVIAGLIGEDRFVYDVYSDAVNTAARMERHGDVNRIHVSNDFFQHLQNRLLLNAAGGMNLHFVRRGDVEIKGKGLMRTYFMESAPLRTKEASQ